MTCEYLWTFHRKTYRDETKPRKQKLSLYCSSRGYLQMQATWYHAVLASPQLQWSFIPRCWHQNVMSLWSKGNYSHQSWTITRRKSRQNKDSDVQPAWLQICHGILSLSLSLLSSFFSCNFCNIFSPLSHLNKEPLFQKCPKTFFVAEIKKKCMLRMRQNSQTYFWYTANIACLKGRIFCGGLRTWSCMEK